jgi:rRNA maturation RNase YbeY
VPTARKNAKIYDDSFKREVVRLIVHGVLHLLGYRDHGSTARARMWAKQEALVGWLEPRA